MVLVGPRRGPLVEDPDGSRQYCSCQCDQFIIELLLSFLACLRRVIFMRGFEKGKVRIVIELGVLKSDR